MEKDPTLTDQQKDKSDVVTCASSRNKISSSEKSNNLADLGSKPWRNRSVSGNGFFPRMNQQGTSPPLSQACIGSVTDTGYYNTPNFRRKHSYQEINTFDSSPEVCPEKIQKMSDDGFAGMDLKSPPEGLKAKRYNKTAEALKMSGLMDITMKTADLLKKNKQLQKELDKLKKDSKTFLQNVLKNPENHQIRDTYFQHLTSESS